MDNQKWYVFHRCADVTYDPGLLPDEGHRPDTTGRSGKGRRVFREPILCHAPEVRNGYDPDSDLRDVSTR